MHRPALVLSFLRRFSDSPPSPLCSHRQYIEQGRANMRLAKLDLLGQLLSAALVYRNPAPSESQ
jgi:hypothetical protein